MSGLLQVRLLPSRLLLQAAAPPTGQTEPRRHRLDSCQESPHQGAFKKVPLPFKTDPVTINVVADFNPCFCPAGLTCLSTCHRTLRQLQGRPPRVLWPCHPSSPSPALRRRQKHRMLIRLTWHKSKVQTSDWWRVLKLLLKVFTF